MDEEINAEIWVQADDNTSFKQSQIQGFLYGPDNRYRKGRHVVRNCLKDWGDQEIWSEIDNTGERYDELDKKMEQVIRTHQVMIIFEEYKRLIRETTNDPHPRNRELFRILDGSR